MISGLGEHTPASAVQMGLTQAIIRVRPPAGLTGGPYASIRTAPPKRPGRRGKTATRHGAPTGRNRVPACSSGSDAARAAGSAVGPLGPDLLNLTQGRSQIG